MDTTLFMLGGTPVTLFMALLAAAFLCVLIMGAVMLVMLRSNRERIEEAARTATEGLRSNFVQQLAERDTRLRQADDRLQAEQKSNARLQAENEGLRVRLEEQKRSAEENIARFQNARQQMTDEFKLVATDIMKVHSETFTKQNREQVDQLLKPLNEKILEFQTGLRKDHAEMGERIRLLHEESLRMTSEANNLTRALKGNSQTQGAWGEMILSSILERAGLREGEHFIVQQSHAGEDGGRHRTDVEIIMPNDDRLVIDSKVSLTAFEAFTNATEDDERALHLKAHVTSLRGHVKTLGAKEYHRHAGSSLDFVMMFVPIEAAFSSAITSDADLIDYAIRQGVLITTPTTLMSALRTVRNVWDIEKRHQNAEEIADRAGKLYDKVMGFLASMDKLDTDLGRARKSFDDAKGQLVTGRGSVMRQIQQLDELGAKNNKSLPAGWEPSEAPAQALTSKAPATPELDFSAEETSAEAGE